MNKQKDDTQHTSTQSDATRSQSTDKGMAKHGQSTETKSAINLTRRGHQMRSITKEK